MKYIDRRLSSEHALFSSGLLSKHRRSDSGSKPIPSPFNHFQACSCKKWEASTSHGQQTSSHHKNDCGIFTCWTAFVSKLYMQQYKNSRFRIAVCNSNTWVFNAKRLCVTLFCETNCLRFFFNYFMSQLGTHYALQLMIQVQVLTYALPIQMAKIFPTLQISGRCE